MSSSEPVVASARLLSTLSIPSPAQSLPPLLSVSGLGVVIDRGNTELRPVDGVDLTIAAGETFALL